MVFVILVMPVLETLTSAICSFIEVCRAECNLQITKYNNLMQHASIPEKDAHPIGFQINEAEDEVQDEIL